MKAPHLDPEEAVYSIINYQQGILVIYTAKETSLPELEGRLSSFLEKSGLKRCLREVGCGSAVKGLENLGTAVRECICANASCRLGHLENVSFGDTGLDQILLPLKDSPWTEKYYAGILSRLTDHDDRHGAKLLETLLEYVENSGDMKLTAQKMFQHSNTIRYRIGKIRKLLELEDDAHSLAQLYIFVRLHKIYIHSETM